MKTNKYTAKYTIPNHLGANINFHSFVTIKGINSETDAKSIFNTIVGFCIEEIKKHSPNLTLTETDISFKFISLLDSSEIINP